MKLYRKYIRPMRGYPGQYYEPKTEPIEKEEKWYPEEEREYLENKYSYLNKRSFSDLIFEEKYEPYDALELLKEQEAVEPKQIVRKQCKTEHSDGSVDYYAEWFCPHCNSLLKRGFDASWIEYCFKCGKPITWEGR